MSTRVALKEIEEGGSNTGNGSAPRMGLLGPVQSPYVAERPDLLTVKQLHKVFGVEPMTIWFWRTAPKRKTPLPYHKVQKGERHGVRFDLDEVVKWAEENKVWYDRNQVEELKRSSA